MQVKELLNDIQKTNGNDFFKIFMFLHNNDYMTFKKNINELLETPKFKNRYAEKNVLQYYLARTFTGNRLIQIWV